ncbi:MAG: ArsR/SmtB family transcription factor [Chromatocurvus sp.]
MDTLSANESFSALSQETRLKAFRLLVQNEPDGLPAGEIARRLQVPHNTLSAHLSVLLQAGLVTARRQSRSIIYSARLSHMREIICFLIHDCCSGHPDVCGLLPALEEPVEGNHKLIETGVEI